jgi:tRNA pseudouridine38-40 synthase
MRYFIEFSYKGTGYHGWQRQNNAISIQEKLEDALSILLTHTVEVVGSSRTDAGVHAEQQYAHFDVENGIKIPLQKLVYSMNAILPRDIAVHRVFNVKDDAHSRFDALYRRYEYRIVANKNPFDYEIAWLYKGELDIDKMNHAATLLLQYKDFESFSKLHSDVKTHICHISRAEWFWQGHQLIFTVKANRFLRGMVRALVGTLIEVGRGKLTVDDFEAIIQARDRNKAGAQAPAHGLTLVEVGY